MPNTSPTAAIILIGNELLSGRTADANMNFLARRLNDIGIKLQEVRVIRDDVETIVKTVNTVRKNYDYIFTTGGIGPTHDDMTTTAIAQAFGVELDRSERIVHAFQQALPPEKLTEATYKMADYPVGAEIIPTPVTPAPGFRLGNVFVMAGIPTICQAMFEAALPLLEQGEQVYSKSVDVLMGESLVSKDLAEVQDHYPELEIGSYPFRAGDRYGTSLVVRGTNQSQVNEALAAVEQFLDSLGAERR